MKQITTIICIAGLTGLSASAFSFPATIADTADIPINMKPALFSQPIHIAASGTKIDNKSASQPAIQGNEMQDERIEFEEEAARREFGDKSNLEEFKEQEIRREFGGQTKFSEPVPQVGDHDR